MLALIDASARTSRSLLRTPRSIEHYRRTLSPLSQPTFAFCYQTDPDQRTHIRPHVALLPCPFDVKIAAQTPETGCTESGPGPLFAGQFALRRRWSSLVLPSLMVVMMMMMMMIAPGTCRASTEGFRPSQLSHYNQRPFLPLVEARLLIIPPHVPSIPPFPPCASHLSTTSLL